jgi:membrane protein YdbS with pleckstrin-like domain
MPGRIAAATMNPRKSRAITALSFHNPRASATIPMTTSAATADRFAVSFMTRDFSPRREARKPMVRSASEQVRLHERRHAIVLAGPLVRAAGLAAGGVAAFVVGWPLSVVGVVLLALAAAIVFRAVWRWERTHVVLTSEKLFVVHGTVRRRSAAVRLERIGAVEIEQGLVGRLLGYGTVVAGDLEITHVPEPARLVERLSP